MSDVFRIRRGTPLQPSAEEKNQKYRAVRSIELEAGSVAEATQDHRMRPDAIFPTFMRTIKDIRRYAPFLLR